MSSGARHCTLPGENSYKSQPLSNLGAWIAGQSGLHVHPRSPPQSRCACSASALRPPRKAAPVRFGGLATTQRHTTSRRCTSWRMTALCHSLSVVVPLWPRQAVTKAPVSGRLSRRCLIASCTRLPSSSMAPSSPSVQASKCPTHGKYARLAICHVSYVHAKRKSVASTYGSAVSERKHRHGSLSAFVQESSRRTRCMMATFL
mmetsp:Transcript_6344/g.19039  ORF Transcript_6344/g.19039 Transcript_6344/m.19039 type:complete len:203 (+) Transcript_6344:129-737(+)